MRLKKGELLMALFLFLFTLVIILASFHYTAETRIVPLVVGGATGLLLLVVITNTIRPLSILKKLDIDLTKKYKQEELNILTENRVGSQQLLGIILWIIFFFLMIFAIGFHLSIPLCTVIFLKVQGKAAWPRALISGVVIWAVVFVLFEVAMDFSLYRGWLLGEVIPPI